jgi:hypothetical protein
MQELLLSLQPANYGIPWHGFHRKIAVIFWTPSGKLTACYGKSPFLIGKSIISGHFQ